MKMDAAKIRPVPTELKKLNEVHRRPSILNAGSRSEIVYLTLDQLIPYQKQVRQKFDDSELQQLALTIQEHGIRQPLTVLRTHVDNAVFEVISGERRLKAAIIAGLTRVPCIIIDDQEAAEEISLIENIQRQDLHPIELSRALAALVAKSNRGKQKELSERLGLSKSQISELIKLATLDEQVQVQLLDTDLRSRDHLRAIQKLSAIDQQLAFIQKYQKAKFPSQASTKTSNMAAMSVLRIKIEAGQFNVQHRGIQRLNSDQREKLREILQDLLRLL
ncbi:MAG TPA: ParB/RepB/Spo0J family partition protein [Candidatus Nitrosotenuis sp.]|jgi:ParB family chromosome partitioning protein|nr:ParB/RepB/Spo0J family partition protein [Candidatus Nitrosotenuis sp.]